MHGCTLVHIKQKCHPRNFLSIVLVCLLCNNIQMLAENLNFQGGGGGGGGGGGDLINTYSNVA